jgi:hypothetical protein
MVHVLLPYLILPLYTNMRAIPATYLHAASTCGATPARAFVAIYFPLTLPGFVVGLTLVFTLSLGFFITPAILGGGKLMMWANYVAIRIDRLPALGSRLCGRRRSPAADPVVGRGPASERPSSAPLEGPPGRVLKWRGSSGSA